MNTSPTQIILAEIGADLTATVYLWKKYIRCTRMYAEAMGLKIVDERNR